MYCISHAVTETANYLSYLLSYRQQFPIYSRLAARNAVVNFLNSDKAKAASHLSHIFARG